MTLTEQIFQLTAPFDNPYQGTDKKILFVCSAGLLRSATAANIFGSKGYNTRAAGSASYALVPISANLIAWADKIVFVNKENHSQAIQTFKDHDYSLDKLNECSIVLNVPDKYHYKHPELIKALEEQLEGKL